MSMTVNTMDEREADMGRLTENESMDLFAESLQDDKRKLQSEIARLGAEVVQLKHRLSERADAHDRLRGRAEDAEADLARLRVKYGATHDCKEKAWAEAERLRGRAERAEATLRAIARYDDGARDFASRNAVTTLAVDLCGMAKQTLAELDAAPAGEGNLCPMCEERPVSTSLGFCGWCDDTQGEDPSELLARLAAKRAGEGGDHGNP
jgi:hypothetical protein